jgi:hypothetical protein
MQTVIKSDFIGSFKTGDNINHNLEILALLYKFYKAASEPEKRLLCKPIIVTNASITEALLHDLHFRMNFFTTEGVRNISQKVLDYVRGKHIDEFGSYIASAKKHDLLKAKQTNLYDELDELRKLRNRIHIQNLKGGFERDESEAFNETRKRQSETTLERVMKTISKHYGRGEGYGHVADFILPWRKNVS